VKYLSSNIIYLTRITKHVIHFVQVIIVGNDVSV